MPTLSYNEAKNRQIRFRHIFFPSAYGFISEIVIAVLALIWFNVSDLSNQLLTKNFGGTDPLPLWSQLLRKLLDSTQNHDAVQQVLLFALWAVVGALVYVLVFRLAQIFFGVKRSVGIGLKFVKQDHSRGIFRWLASLHDFFIKLFIVLIGSLALLSGSVICFGIASQELMDGLSASFPASSWNLLLSLLAAVLSIRLIALGLSLLSRHFRNWYTT